ncbi:MAG: lipoyl(octanoyl) transferase LipB [Demequinaceae bacterium]|nr:lipoyl(octanoyl) transferase LipB [Demequinaceae bacterium]
MDILDLGIGVRLVDYYDAWALQREILVDVADGTRPDTLILVEHPSVYTAGKRTARWEHPTDGTPVVDVDRGGRITWHGPGQLVGYPIVKLNEPIDVIRYVRALEDAIIDVCAGLGLKTGRVEARTGVWIPADAAHRERKVCAIGVRVSRGVTMHGFALNCNPDLTGFSRIVPCGLDDADVTSLSAELGRDVTVAEVVPSVVDALEMALADVRLSSPLAKEIPS